MIKANELRIGNWVTGPKNTPIEVTGSILYGISEDSFYQEKTNPIPLTPEILGMCGFIKEEFYTCFTHSDINAFELEETEDGFLPTINNEYSAGLEIKYLHQLQNKFFDWLQKELPITL